MSGECILVIDDSHEMVRHLTEDLLPSFGYKSIHAFDGQTGLSLIREGKPDLVMLDYNLPEMTGIDVLQQMVQESINTPVVLMTAYGSELSAIKAFRLGAKDYLIKPFTVDEIVETIDRALVETRLLHDKENLVEQLRRVKSEMSRQTNEMKTLFNIGKAITSLLSVDQVLERVLEAATYLTNAEDSTIWMPDESEERLHAYERKDGHASETSFPKLSMTDSQVGQVMRTGRPLRQSIFSGKGIKLKTGYFARAVLYVPLKLRGMTLGVLGVSNVSASRSFSRRDEFLLSFLADYAAIALENARVFQAADRALTDRLEELNTLIDITRTIISSLDLDEVVRLTIKQVHNSWNIEASSLWLLNEVRQTLRVLANVGTAPEVLDKVEVPVGRGIVGEVVRTGKWIYTNDIAAHPLHYREIDDITGFHTRSLLCVPLLFRGRVIGALQLLNKQDGDFDDQDVERAISIAAAVAIAVTNALLFHESEERKQHLEGTLEYTNNPILITDVNHNIHLLNREARSRLALTPDAVGKPIGDVVQLPALRMLLLADDIDSPEELALDDGSIWLPRLAQIPGHGRILVLQEITWLRELDRAKDDFVTAVSHDMRAPLNTINGYVNMLTDVGPLNAQQLDFVQRIHTASKYMMSLVDDLLELARVDIQMSPTRQPCDMVSIVTDVLHEFQGQSLHQNINLQLLVEGNVRPVMGDPAQLRRAIGNLVDNAIKYSPRNSKVQVTILGSSKKVTITLRDWGPGIDDADLPHIFDKFYRGTVKKAEIAGTGLGLALVRSIAEAHDGKAWVQNFGEDGSAFSIQIPVTTTESSAVDG